MRRRAEEVGSREIAALADKGELLGPVMTYNFAHSQRRHYERLRKFPEGLLVMGDALARVAAAFVKVMHLVAPPPTLMAPALLWRVLRHRQSPASIGASTASAVAA